ncbi:MAG: carboxylesterase/lipase family protein [Acidimicrobiia bacterium]
MTDHLARCSRGALRGGRDGDVLVFRGVPYAAPPVGELRWRRPRPVAPWAGVRDALEFGPVASQPSASGPKGSEDCLYLNVWTPAVDDRQRPVVVAVHGGGLMTGSASSRLTNGAELSARGDVVVVGVTYRLGALGTIYAPEHLDSDGDSSTNLAVWDVLTALRFVRAEIAAFGGDPDNVTAMGHSSGAVILGCILASEAGRGAFDKVILQSGGMEQVRTVAQARRTGERFWDALTAGAHDDPRTIPVERILDAQIKAAAVKSMVPPNAITHPTIDGELPAVHPITAAARGETHDVALLIGSTWDEWRWMDHPADASLDDAEVRRRVRALLGEFHEPIEITESAIDEVIDIYRRGLEAHARPTDSRWLASMLVTDFHFCVSNYQLALSHAKAGRVAFHYVIDWPAPGDELGSCHGMCVPLVFGTLEVAAKLVGDAEAARPVSRMVQDAWLSFVRHGDPSCGSVGEWPPLSASTRPTMVIGPSTAHIENPHRAEMIGVWDHAYDRIDRRV